VFELKPQPPFDDVVAKVWTEAVRPLIEVIPPPAEQPVHDETVSAPMFPLVANRFVVDAFVAKKLVVVAEVPVAVVKVKDWRVEEALERKPPVRFERPETARVPVAVRLPPIYESPATESFVNGEVVPIPMFPS